MLHWARFRDFRNLGGFRIKNFQRTLVATVCIPVRITLSNHVQEDPNYGTSQSVMPNL
jgi:hypothetical protein